MTENTKYPEEEKEFNGNNFEIKLSPEPRQDGKKWVPNIVLTIYGRGDERTIEHILHPEGKTYDDIKKAYEVSKEMAKAIIIQRGLT